MNLRIIGNSAQWGAMMIKLTELVDKLIDVHALHGNVDVDGIIIYQGKIYVNSVGGKQYVMEYGMMMTMRRCPVCGSKSHLIERKDRHQFRGECKNHNCGAHDSNWHDTLINALRSWNEGEVRE